MSTTAEKFSLRPQEKRLLAGIGMALFVAFNIWYVWPKFKDWGVEQTKIRAARAKLAQYQAEIAKLPQYQAELIEVQGKEAGPEVISVDQTIDFRRKVESLALAENVFVQNMTGPNRSGGVVTNQFFEEWNLSMNVNGGEKNLVELLYKLSGGNSTIRVRDLVLNPVANTTNLNARIVLVANYQKNTAAPAAAPKKP